MDGSCCLVKRGRLQKAGLMGGTRDWVVNALHLRCQQTPVEMLGR